MQAFSYVFAEERVNFHFADEETKNPSSKWLALGRQLLSVT